MASSTNWEFYKEAETKILWFNICAQDLKVVAISINNWWKTRYPEFKIRVVSKKNLTYKNACQGKGAINYSFVNFDAENLIYIANIK